MDLHRLSVKSTPHPLDFNPHLVRNRPVFDVPQPDAADRDYSLVRRTLSGDTAAYGELYSIHYLRLFRTMVHITRNVEDAEDMAQGAFTKALDKLHMFRGDSQFSTWIHSIAVNEFLMMARDVRRREGYGEHIPIELLAVIPGVRDRILESTVDRVVLNECIELLPPGQRRVFTLRSGGYSIEETRLMIGKSEGCVKSQYLRAKHNIRKMLRTKTGRHQLTRKYREATATPAQTTVRVPLPPMRSPQSPVVATSRFLLHPRTSPAAPAPV